MLCSSIFRFCLPRIVRDNVGHFDTLWCDIHVVGCVVFILHNALNILVSVLFFLCLGRLKALAQRKRVRKKEREAASRLRSRVAMGMENHAVDLPQEEGIFSLASIKVSERCIRLAYVP